MVSCKTHLPKLFSISLLLLLCFPGAMALTITMSNPDATMQRDIIVYSINETGLTNTTPLYGLYNTTSIIDIDPNSSYLFVLKPQYSNPLDDPGAWLKATLDYVHSNLASLLIIMFLIGLILVRK